MRTRRLYAVALLTMLLLMLAVRVTAQGPDPATQGDTPLPAPPNGDSGARAPAAPAVALRQPGTVFRYLQTFGYTETAYFEDSNHLFLPYGLGVDGNNIWIAESQGLRALKFNGATGAFSTQIGKAGFRDSIPANNAALDSLQSVGVSSGGDIWIVDSSAHHLLKFNSSGTFVSELGQEFSSGSDNSHFRSPSDIAFDSAGNLYVSDTSNHRIQIFGSGGTYSATIGVSGVPTSTNAGFNSTRHIAIDNANRLYVSDVNNQRVQIFDVSNPLAASYVATLGVSGVSGSDNAHLNGPRGVHVDGSRIYVADANNNRVQIFDRSTFAYQSTIGTGVAGPANNQFSFPTDVAVTASGDIFVADEVNERVQQFSSGLTYIRTYGTTGVPYLTDNYHYNRPVGMAVATDGSIYVSEERGQRLIKLNAAGVPQWAVGEAGVTGSDNNHFNQPYDIALDSGGKVYVADSGNHRIQVFNANGSYYNTFGSGFGTGNYNFNFPRGLYIAPDDTLYITDQNNHRVQIYNSSHVYASTLGVTASSGSDNAHFNSPRDVVVDGNGVIYVSDANNERVQVFNSGLAYQRTIGTTGVSGNDNDHLSSGPHQMVIDSHNNIIIADSYNSRIQVFDSSGGYLTTIGASYGRLTGQLRSGFGLALDASGNLYVADNLNHRIQKYAPGVPGWRPVNINGFGERQNNALGALASFGGQLYAGGNSTNNTGAEIWRAPDGMHWTPVITNGFGITRNFALDQLYEYNGQLYASTLADNLQGAEILRSNDGTNWSPVATGGFGDTTNIGVDYFTVFSSTLYATTQSFATHGFEIWRSTTGNAGDWTRVISNGFGIGTNNGGAFLTVYQGLLYAGVSNFSNGAQLWRSNDGISWTQIISGGLGADNSSFSSFAEFNGFLYLSTRNLTQGAQIWRSPDGVAWSQVASGGLGDVNSVRDFGLIVFNGKLYTYLVNAVTGIQVWRSADGTQWVPVENDGWGDSNNNSMTNYNKDATIFNGHLYFGSSNSANGGELWEFIDQQLFLPAIQR